MKVLPKKPPLDVVDLIDKRTGLMLFQSDFVSSANTRPLPSPTAQSLGQFSACKYLTLSIFNAPVVIALNVIRAASTITPKCMINFRRNETNIVVAVSATAI